MDEHEGGPVGGAEPTEATPPAVEYAPTEDAAERSVSSLLL